MTVGVAGTALGTVSAYVAQRIQRRLDEREIVVWYDGEGAFGELLRRIEGDLAASGCVVVSGSESRLRARREADAAYIQIGERDGPTSLLIYLAEPRGQSKEAQQADPFAAYAEIGCAFGDRDAEHLRELAEAALPDRTAAIARLFNAGRPGLATLDALGADDAARHPLLRQALGSDDPADVFTRALAMPDAGKRLAAVSGAKDELAQLAAAALGLPATSNESWKSLRGRLATLILVSELAADLPDGLPPALAGVPHAEGTARTLALDVCDRLRGSDAGREALARAAREAETALHLAQALGSDPALGARDTFPLQENARLRAVVRLAAAGELAAAREALAGAADSVWRRDEERRQIWAAAERCLAFLEVVVEGEGERTRLPKTVGGLVERYVAGDGLWRLDRAQRRFEQAGAECAQDEAVDPLLQHCRARYLAVVAPVQTSFQAAVQAQGWPPEGVRRQTETFDRRVAPELTSRHRVAYFLVDSLRYEMGRDLGQALDDLGTVEVDAAAAALPTWTPNGMAALLPGAAGALKLVQDDGELIPAIGDHRLPLLKDRQALFKARLGDRYLDLTLEETLVSPKRLAKQIGNADLLVVRSLDIDDLGEGRSYHRARKVMTEVIGELKTAVERLIDAGVTTFVFAADHGHILIPEIPPGDVLPIPAGEWLLKKRRSLLGRHRATAPGVLILRAADVGIQSDMPDLELAVASGLKTFRDDAGYFHEGLSLQECLVPIVVLRAKDASGAIGGGEQVSITYRSDRFTSSVIGLKVRLTAMLTPELVVRLEAFDGAGAKAVRVGQAGDCEARDPVTGEVTLRAGEETQAPLIVDPDFSGPSIEIRATDPRTGVVYATLKLKNARLD